MQSAVGTEVCRGIRIEESAPLGVVVTGLEVIEASFLVAILAAVCKNRTPRGREIPPSGFKDVSVVYKTN